MAEQASMRIDWFDGTVINETKPSQSYEDEEEASQPSDAVPSPRFTEKKLMGFKRLYDLSQQEFSSLILQLSSKSSFWDLIDTELKGDFVVLIVKILSKLYSALQAGQKSVMLSNLLKNKLFSSTFFNTLNDYLQGLPQVRIVEKRMNMQFWDDVETFYWNVFNLCEGIYHVNKDFRHVLPSLLSSLKFSIYGVMEEHRETFSEDLFQRIELFGSNLGEIAVENPTKVPNDAQNKPMGNETNFRHLNIFPNKKDLLDKSSLLVKPNIVNGAYSSVEHYLDVQFKLLREDCFGPLRDGISKYMENPLKRRHENIRVHQKVRLIRTYVANNKVGYLLDLAWRDRVDQNSVDNRKYAYNKQLMFGSLLLLTSDNFETILCATVLDSNVNLLCDGYIAIILHSPVSKSVFSQTFLMIESEVFFEPYHRVLQVLQNSRTDDIPMKRYIVDVQHNTDSPHYLTKETNYTIEYQGNDINFPVLDTQSWPDKDKFSLDSNQMDAFKLALTREFAVIQGPPGTGKTFIGIEIAAILLKNLSLDGTPMLIVCYTNHALDQFLEGILGTTKNVIRLGSQSKNENIAQYTLNSLRSKSKSKYSHIYASKKSEQESIFKQMVELQNEVEKTEKEIVSYDNIKEYLKEKSIVLKESSNDDAILKWLFSHIDDDVECNNEIDIDENADDWENLIDCEIKNDDLKTCFSEEWANKEIGSMMNSIKYVDDVTDDNVAGDSMKYRFQCQIDKVRKRLDCFKRELRKYHSGKSEKLKLNKHVKDPYSLSPEEKWQTYFEAVDLIKDKLVASMTSLQAKYNVCSAELEEISTLIDSELVKTARVVGVTTSTAARRHDLLQTLRSPIVIVEEAAEVLEAHIVASLTHYCQHLILIGDHKQLRPSAAHYILAKEYNLEISLFERMIRNGVHARALNTQRRMRSVFTRLLVPDLYEQLYDHECVSKYENVRGVASNLFFIDHEVFEDEGIQDSSSHKNKYEAKWCVALANYFRCKMYKPEEVTILATYTGQVKLIKELTKNYPKLRDINVTAVDNFQGEESRIVILSLVRSNRDRRIGFLSAQNRVCVALSRAKEGNMGVLKSTSKLWNSVSTKLEKMDAIGKSFTLKCDIHEDNLMKIYNPDDLDKCLSGTCLTLCGIK